MTRHYGLHHLSGAPLRGWAVSHDLICGFFTSQSVWLWRVMCFPFTKNRTDRSEQHSGHRHTQLRGLCICASEMFNFNHLAATEFQLRNDLAIDKRSKNNCSGNGKLHSLFFQEHFISAPITEWPQMTVGDRQEWIDQIERVEYIYVFDESMRNLCCCIWWEVQR